MNVRGFDQPAASIAKQHLMFDEIGLRKANFVDEPVPVACIVGTTERSGKRIGTNITI
jgi:hypothetical protein